MENQKLTITTKSVTSISAVNDPTQHRTIIDTLAPTIDQAFDKPPVKQLMNAGADRIQIENILAVIILKWSSMLSVSGNLKQGQAIEIAKMLIDEHPYHSIDDFNLMLMRGVKGRYGQIFRFDVSVVFDWMNKFIDEYYQEKEERQKRISQIRHVVDDEIKPTLTEEESERVNELIENFLTNLKSMNVKPVSPLTDAEIKREGRLNPDRKKYHYTTDPELVTMHQLKLEWIKTFHDPRTGEKTDEWLSFDEWLKSQR